MLEDILTVQESGTAGHTRTRQYKCHTCVCQSLNKKGLSSCVTTTATSGVFNELLWACDGTAWDTVGCSALRDAIFCLSNYYLIDRLNSARGYSKANWIKRDGGDEGLTVS